MFQSLPRTLIHELWNQDLFHDLWSKVNISLNNNSVNVWTRDKISFIYEQSLVVIFYGANQYGSKEYEF